MNCWPLSAVIGWFVIGIVVGITLSVAVVMAHAIGKEAGEMKK